MCKPGNQTIYRACREMIIKRTGNPHLSNQEQRRLLCLHEGCMEQRLALDKKVVLVKG